MIPLEALHHAWLAVRKHPLPGVDGVGRRTFEANLDLRLRALHRSLLDGSYQPGPLRHVRRAKPDGGERLLSIPGLADRVAQRAVLDVVQGAVDPRLSPQVYGYRPGRSPGAAVRALLAEAVGALRGACGSGRSAGPVDLLGRVSPGLPFGVQSRLPRVGQAARLLQGCLPPARGALGAVLRSWERARVDPTTRERAERQVEVPLTLVRARVEVVKVDIRSLFDELPLPGVERAALAAHRHPVWGRLVRVWLAAWATSPGRGVPQGAPLSPLLANLYLDVALDRPLTATMASLGVLSWVRFGDDVCLVTRAGCGLRALTWLEATARRAGLELSERKTVLGIGQVGAVLTPIVLGRTLWR